MPARRIDLDLRCAWAIDVPTAYVEYHDHEWGVPVHDDRALFERVCLEGFQAGLSWWTILSRREAFREVFADFEPKIVAQFTEAKIAELKTDPRIIRHEGKIRAVIGNAKAVLALGEGGLTELIWSHRPERDGRPQSQAEVPAVTVESLALSKALKEAGFGFVGPTTAYALMQACGLVNDHRVGCTAGDRLAASVPWD